MRRYISFWRKALISATVVLSIATAGWSQRPLIIWLGTLGGTEGRPWGVSADGTVVVGWALNAAGQLRAFRWTPTGGMDDLNITYAHLLTDGSVLLEAGAISPNGRYTNSY